MDTSRSINWVVAIIGVWEVLAPFVLGYAEIEAAMWNAVLVGLALIVLAVWSALTLDPGTAKTLDWVAAAVGVWLILSSFVIGYAEVEEAMWNSIIVGLAVVILEVWAALSIRQPARTSPIA